MRVVHKMEGDQPAAGGKWGERLPLRLAVAALLLGLVWGAKTYLPVPAAPAMAVLNRTLTEGTSLAAVTETLGQIAAGEEELSALLGMMLPGQQETASRSSAAHWQAECAFLGQNGGADAAFVHYLTLGEKAPDWLSPLGGETPNG